MSALAKYLARICWWWLLWFMRRPWMKGLQLAYVRRMRRKDRLDAIEKFIAQNRFARRHGLALLTLSFNMLLASVAVTATYYSVLALYVNGYLSPPEQISVRR